MTFSTDEFALLIEKCNSQAFGGYWYILAVRRIASCLTQQCAAIRKCDQLQLSCSRVVYYGDSSFGKNATAIARSSMCLDEDGPFPYGIYQFALPLMSTNSFIIKILYSNLWGLMALRLANCKFWLFCNLPNLDIRIQ